MASSKDFNFEGSVSGYGDEEFRGDGKKRKFKPLSAMKKFFTKKRDKKDTVVAVKAKSTTALHSDYRTEDYEDDDDGGFKNHPRPLALAGNRSLSEDSVFSPEQRAPPIAAFPKAAVSEESLPKSAFQSELLSKLNQRRSQYSDDDDGLPRSPVPPVTTADVILGEPLKKQPGPSGKKSNNRDSDQSLISVDSSENEEEDFFHSKWKSSVPAKKSAGGKSKSVDAMDSLDLNSIQKTELLVSTAAKDKIMVKPSRKGMKQARKKRDTPSPPAPLPSLNEESPTGSKPEDVTGSWISGSPIAKSPEKHTFSDDKLPSSPTSLASMSVDKDKSEPGVRASGKPSLSSITITPKDNNIGSPLTSPSSLSPPIVASTAAVAAAAPPTKVTSPTSVSVMHVSASPTKMIVQSSSSAVTPATPPPKVTTPTSPSAASLSQNKVDIFNSAEQINTLSSPGIPVNTNVMDMTSSSTIYEKLSVSERGNKTSLAGITDISVTSLSQSQQELNETKPSIDIRSRMSQFQTPAAASSKSDSSSSITANNQLVKEASDSLPVGSIKDEYKLKHQIRSKTLPAVLNESSSAKVQRSSSHRIQNSGTDVSEEPQEEPLKLSDDNAGHPLTITSSGPTSSDAKKLENVKVSSTESTPLSAGEPSWINMARRRKDEQEIKLESEKTKPIEAATQKPAANMSAPKSVFTSASYLEKKRSSVETVSYKNRDLSENILRRADNSDAKRQTLDPSSQNKRFSTDVSSSQKESIEIDVTQLGSVRASRSLFDPKSGNQRESVLPLVSAAPVATERSKQFSGSSTTVSSTSVKPTSSIGQEPTVATDNAKPTLASSGITHNRGGSVKAATSSEARSSFYSRGGSIKVSSSSSTTLGSSLPPETEPATSVSRKTGLASGFKQDTSGAFFAPPSTSAPSSAPHAPMHVAAQPNTSLPSQTTSVTPVTFYVKPFNASNPTNFAFASRPAYTATHPINKNSATATATSTSLASDANGIKTASNTASGKGVSSSSAVPVASTPITANISTSVPSAMPIVSASSSSVATTISSSYSTTTTTSSSALTSSSSSRSNLVRPHSSFSTSAAYKPHITRTSPSHPTSTSPLTKSPSFKAATTPAVSKERKTSTEKPSSFEKGASSEKLTSGENAAVELRKTSTSAKVPAWRTNLSSKEVTIELIENSPSTASSSSSQTKSSDILRKGHDSSKLNEKTETSSDAGLAGDTEKNRRTSKVLDMVKNFQNFQNVQAT